MPKPQRQPAAETAQGELDQAQESAAEPAASNIAPDAESEALTGESDLAATTDAAKDNAAPGEAESAVEDDAPPPGVINLLRQQIAAHMAAGDAYSTVPLEALIIKLHEVENDIQAVVDKTDGELAVWLVTLFEII